MKKESRDSKTNFPMQKSYSRKLRKRRESKSWPNKNWNRKILLMRSRLKKRSKENYR